MHRSFARPLRSFTLTARVLTAVCAAVLVATPVVGQGTGFLYWAGVNGEGMWRAQLDGSQMKKVVGTSSPSFDLATDLVNDKLYFVVRRNRSTADEVVEIWRSDLDGRSQERVVSTALTVEAIALDPAGGRMYWAEGPWLRRANLDGQSAETLYTSTSRINDFALDLTAAPNPRIYFIDSVAGGPTELRSMRLDGSEVETLPNPMINMVRIAVDEANDRLFLAGQQATDSIHRLNQDGTGLVALGIDRPSAQLQVAGGRLFFNDGSLESVDLDGNDRQTEVTAAGPINDFVLDQGGGRLFLRSNQIHRIDLDGSDETPLIGQIPFTNHDLAVTADGTLVLATELVGLVVVGGPSGDILGRTVSADGFEEVRGLTLGPTADTVYWASNDGWVGRIGIDGTGLVQLFGETGAHDVAVDSAAGTLYWTANIGPAGNPDMKAVIRKAELDFQSPDDVIAGLPRGIRGLDVDESSGQIYFTDSSTDQLRRVDADGTGLVDIVAATAPHDVVVDEAGGFFYWTEGISSAASFDASIRRLPLGGAGPAQDVLTGLRSTIRDLTLVHLPDHIFEDNFESGDTSAWSATR